MAWVDVLGTGTGPQLVRQEEESCVALLGTAVPYLGSSLGQALRVTRVHV